MNDFQPPFLLQNRHVQSILSSISVRLAFIRRRARRMRDAAVSHILDCGNNVRLQGYYSGHNPGHNDLCILIHGWEGSSESSYLLSAASSLWNSGFDVFRLNMRDHGPTHQLNKGLFHSCRIDEVVGAVKRVSEKFSHQRLFLAGFSLGGNFALRIAVRAPDAGIRLEKVAAVCPVLYPPHTLHAMETGLQIYHLYFMKKWRDSLRVKRRYFPHLNALNHIPGFHTIGEMTDYFVRNFTDFPDMMTYLKGYAITGTALRHLCVPSAIIASVDDPIIPVKDLSELASSDFLAIETTRLGGHCGFLKDMYLNSWTDGRLKALFSTKG